MLIWLYLWRDYNNERFFVLFYEECLGFLMFYNIFMNIEWLFDGVYSLKFLFEKI